MNRQTVDNLDYVKWIMALTSTFAKKLFTYLTAMLRFTRAGEPLAVSSKARRNAFGLSLCLAAISMQTMPLNAATSSDYYKLYIHSKIIDYKQFQCAIQIGDRESHWNPTAVNGNHYGIFQMNNKKVKHMNPFTQIDWWIKYIKNRYHGSYCTALEHLKKRGWQ